MLAWKGDDATAVDQAERAIRLSPFDPLLYLPYVGLAYAHFAAGRFEEAAAAAGRASQSNPKFSMPYVLQAAALANLGRSEEAMVVVDGLRGRARPHCLHRDPIGALREPGQER